MNHCDKAIVSIKNEISSTHEMTLIVLIVWINYAYFDAHKIVSNVHIWCMGTSFIYNWYIQLFCLATSHQAKHSLGKWTPAQSLSSCTYFSLNNHIVPNVFVVLYTFTFVEMLKASSHGGSFWWVFIYISKFLKNSWNFTDVLNNVMMH